jgi:hypothetical protein
MSFTHAQIFDLLLDLANSENGTNLLMQMTLNAFMKSERHTSAGKSARLCQWLPTEKSQWLWQGNGSKSSKNS